MITTVIFDYGWVLAYPVTGNWFITQKTPEIIGIQTFMSLMSRQDEFSEAFQKSHQYLNENHLLHTEEDELKQFTEFYRLLLTQMSIESHEDIYEKLAADIVYNDDKIAFYDDVSNGLAEFKQKYRIAILSDTWPSLKRILKTKGILPILDALIMSCDYNATKEGTKLFKIAISQLHEDPHNILFIDDSPTNLLNAEKAGLIPILMDRNGRYQDSEYPIARNLNDVQEIIQNLAQ